MKALKWIAITLLALILLVLAGVLITLNSAGLQKSIVMSQLEGKVDHVELDYIKAGFSSVTIRGLALEQDGTVIELPSAQLDYALMSAIFSKELHISKLAVDDLAVTLPAARKVIPTGPGPVRIPTQKAPSTQTPQPTSPEPKEPKEEDSDEREPLPPFEGLFGKAESPVKLFIDGIDITATVAMTQDRKLNLKATGGGIAPGKTGSIDTQCELTDKSANAAASKVNVDAKLQIAQTENMRLNAITLDVKTDASGGTLTAPASLIANVDLKQEESEKEVYTFVLQDGSKAKLVDAKADFDPSAKKLSGVATFAIEDKSLAPITGNAKLPVYALNGNAKFDLDSETYSGTTTLNAKGEVKSLRRVDAKLKRLPDMNFALNYKGDLAEESLTLSTLKFVLSKLDGGNMVQLNLLQPITLESDFDPSELNGDIAELTLGNFALGWLSPLLQGVDISGGGLSGQIKIGTQSGSASIKTTQPIRIANLSVKKGKDSLLEKVTLLTELDASLSDESFSASLPSVLLRNQKGGTLLKLSANAKGKLDDGKTEDTTLDAKGLIAFNNLLEQPFSPQQLAERVDLNLTLRAKQPNANTLNIGTLEAILTGKQKAELATVKLLKPLSIDLENQDKNTPEELIQGDVLRLTIEQLPRPIINAFLGDIQLTSGDLKADLTVSGKSGDINIKANKPVQLTNLSVTQAGKPMLRALSIALEPKIAYNANKTKVVLNNLSLQSGSTKLLSGNADIVATPTAKSPLQSADFDFETNLAQLLKQPVLSDFNNLSAGSATLKGKVTSTKTMNYEVNLTAKNLRVVEPSGVIQNVSAKASGKMNLPESVTFDVPLSVQGPRGKSEVTLNGSLNQKQKPVQFQFNTVGKTIYTEDLQLLAAAFKKPTATAPATQPATTQPAPATSPRPAANKTPVASTTSPTAPPPWADYKGNASVKIDKVVHGQYAVDTIVAQLKVNPTTVLLNPAKANFMGAPLNADVKVDHAPGKRPQKPYALDANLNLNKFDVGKFLTMTQPGMTPPLTGNFTVKGGINSTAASLETLADTAQGQFSLNGGPGQLRALAVNKNADAAAQGVNAALGIAGSLLGNRVRELPALNQLIALLRQIDYDTMQIEAKRGSDLNINLSTFLLKGPQVRLNGTGQVKHVAGTAIPQQPLKINVSLDSKGETANLMSELRLTSGNKDKEGYFVGPNFSINGTPSAPDFSELNSILTKAATGIISGGFGGKVKEDDSTTQQNQKDQTQEAVKGLLNNLLGK